LEKKEIVMQSNKRFRLFIILLIASLLASCSGSKPGKKEEEKKTPNNSGSASAATASARDWNRFPAIVERNTANEVVALGDVHGGYERLVSLLSSAGLIKQDSQAPGGYAWTGGNRLLVCTGDLIDKGDRSLEVIDLMMALESQAPAAGGEVIVTLGNHEAEFLANPGKKKGADFHDELVRKGIDPASIAQGQKPYGEWLMNRPFAARVNDWFFAHGGNTSGHTIQELADGFQKAVNRRDWKSSFLIGEDSLLEAREWWKGQGGAKDLLDDYLAALHCKHIVFGHDPSAFHSKGVMEQNKDGRIFLIDVGMSPAIDYSQGALLLINRAGDEVVATSLAADGKRTELWRGPGATPSN
jgi:hypothetical protein